MVKPSKTRRARARQTMFEDLELVRDMAEIASRLIRALSLAYVVLGVGSVVYLLSTEQTQESLADLTELGRGLHNWQRRLFMVSVGASGFGLFMLYRFARALTAFRSSPWRVPLELFVLPWAAGLYVPLFLYAVIGPYDTLLALILAFLVKVSVAAVGFELSVTRLEGLVGFRMRLLRWVLLAAAMQFVSVVAEGSLQQAGERFSAGGWNVQGSPAEIEAARWRALQWGTAELFGSGVQMFAISRIVRRIGDVAQELRWPTRSV